MSTINREKPHLLIIPEDRDWRKVITGFRLAANVNDRNIKPEPLAGGWPKAFESIENDYAKYMRKYSECRLVLLIDFDNKGDGSAKFEERLANFKNDTPADLRDRVFVLGVLSKEPKDLLSRKLGMSLEKLGEELAKNCTDKVHDLWDHELLRHNKPELERIIPSVKSFLFI